MLARISTFFISTAALILALYFKKISDLIWGIRSYIHPIVFVPFIVGLLGFKAHKYSFIFGGIIGVSSVIIVKNFIGGTALLRLMIGIFSNAIGFFTFHYFSSLYLLHVLL